jgi:copper chaperone CopZ
MKRIRLEVGGMHCGGCLQTVREALAKVPGVQVEEVKIGSATVVMDDESTVGALIDAVYDAGYDAQEAA